MEEEYADSDMFGATTDKPLNYQGGSPKPLNKRTVKKGLSHSIIQPMSRGLVGASMRSSLMLGEIEESVSVMSNSPIPENRAQQINIFKDGAAQLPLQQAAHQGAEQSGQQAAIQKTTSHSIHSFKMPRVNLVPSNSKGLRENEMVLDTGEEQKKPEKDDGNQPDLKPQMSKLSSTSHSIIHETLAKWKKPQSQGDTGKSGSPKKMIPLKDRRKSQNPSEGHVYLDLGMTIRKRFSAIKTKKEAKAISETANSNHQTGNPKIGKKITVRQTYNFHDSEENFWEQHGLDSDNSLVFKELPKDQRGRFLTTQDKKKNSDDESESLESLDESPSHSTFVRRAQIRKKKINENERFQTLEKYRRMLTIPTSSVAYQIWKVLGILLCFVSSFQYAYYASFLSAMSKEQREYFDEMDRIYVYVFLVDIVIHILVDEHNSSERWNLGRSLLEQFKGRLTFDIIAVVPFSNMFEGILPSFYCQLMYFLKAVRLYHGFKLLNYQQYKTQLKEAQLKRIQRLLKEEDPRDINIDQDVSKMSLIMLITEVLKTVRLIIILLCLSFFTGLLWFNFCKILQRMDSSIDQVLISTPVDDSPEEDPNFLVEYALFEESDPSKVVSLTYFAFTTLSTVGLGDFHPKSSLERVLCSFIMLFGVMTTSVIMDNLSNMIQELRDLNKSHDESEQLNLFIGTIRRFNDGISLPADVQIRIEKFFQYRWLNDRNLAVSENSDEQLLSELPRRVRTQIYVDFLFKDFTDIYKHFLDLEKNEFGLKRRKLLKNFTLTESDILNKSDTAPLDISSLFTNDQYEDFIVTFLTYLEPIYFNPGVLISKPDQEAHEAYFLMGGELSVGYNHKEFLLKNSLKLIEKAKSEGDEQKNQLKVLLSQNLTLKFDNNVQKYHYPLKIKGGQVIGLFEILFSRNFQYIYKTAGEDTDAVQSDKKINCFFIRKENVRRLIELGSHVLKKGTLPISTKFENNALINYMEKIYFPIRDYQQSQVALQQRKFDREYMRSQMKSNLVNLMKESATLKKTKSGIGGPVSSPTRKKKFAHKSTKEVHLLLEPNLPDNHLRPNQKKNLDLKSRKKSIFELIDKQDIMIKSRDAAIEMIASNDLRRDQCSCIRSQLSMLMAKKLLLENKDQDDESILKLIEKLQSKFEKYATTLGNSLVKFTIQNVQQDEIIDELREDMLEKDRLIQNITDTAQQNHAVLQEQLQIMSTERDKAVKENNKLKVKLKNSKEKGFQNAMEIRENWKKIDEQTKEIYELKAKIQHMQKEIKMQQKGFISSQTGTFNNLYSGIKRASQQEEYSQHRAQDSPTSPFFVKMEPPSAGKDMDRPAPVFGEAPRIESPSKGHLSSSDSLSDEPQTDSNKSSSRGTVKKRIFIDGESLSKRTINSPDGFSSISPNSPLRISTQSSVMMGSAKGAPLVKKVTLATKKSSNPINDSDEVIKCVDNSYEDRQIGRNPSDISAVSRQLAQEEQVRVTKQSKELQLVVADSKHSSQNNLNVIGLSSNQLQTPVASMKVLRKTHERSLQDIANSSESSVSADRTPPRDGEDDDFRSGSSPLLRASAGADSGMRASMGETRTSGNSHFNHALQVYHDQAMASNHLHSKLKSQNLGTYLQRLKSPMQITFYESNKLEVEPSSPNHALDQLLLAQKQQDEEQSKKRRDSRVRKNLSSNQIRRALESKLIVEKDNKFESSNNLLNDSPNFGSNLGSTKVDRFARINSKDIVYKGAKKTNPHSLHKSGGQKSQRRTRSSRQQDEDHSVISMVEDLDSIQEGILEEESQMEGLTLHNEDVDAKSVSSKAMTPSPNNLSMIYSSEVFRKKGRMHQPSLEIKEEIVSQKIGPSSIYEATIEEDIPDGNSYLEAESHITVDIVGDGGKSEMGGD